MITKQLFNMAIASVAMFTGLTTVAQETVSCYGSSILSYTAGNKKNSSELISDDRRDPSKALGVPENNNTANFVTLGYGGQVTIGFSGNVYDFPGNDIYITETSFASNDCNSDGIERANVELSQNGTDFVAAGSVCRNGSVDISGTGLEYVVAIRITNDDSSTTLDGYDVDGVTALNGCGVPPVAGCYAVSIFSVQQGTKANGQPITDPIRIDPTKALGQPENNRTNGAANFFSLGKDGNIVLKMGGNIKTDGTSAPDLRVYETTWGNLSCANYPEYAEVSVSFDAANWYSLGVVCQSSNISLDLDAALPAGLRVSYVKIENKSSFGTTPDYFDVDGVESLFGCDDEVVPVRGDCYAICRSEVGYVQGTKRDGSPLDSDRTNADNAFGLPQNDDTLNFVTLGYGGSIDLCFGTDVVVFNNEGNDIFITETSYGGVTCDVYHEYADVEVSLDGNTWYYIGTGCLDFSVDISDAPVYLPYIKFIRIKNNDTLSTTEDGYDVDGVRVITGDCPENLTSSTLSPTETQYGVTAWPNPAQENLNYKFKVGATGQATLELYNMSGNLVATLYNDNVREDDVQVGSFNTSKLPNGLYFTKLTTVNGVKTDKIVISH